MTRGNIVPARRGIDFWHVIDTVNKKTVGFACTYGEALRKAREIEALGQKAA